VTYTRQHETLYLRLRIKPLFRCHMHMAVEQPRLACSALALTAGGRDVNPVLCSDLQQCLSFQNRRSSSGARKLDGKPGFNATRPDRLEVHARTSKGLLPDSLRRDTQTHEDATRRLHEQRGAAKEEHLIVYFGNRLADKLTIDMATGTWPFRIGLG